MKKREFGLGLAAACAACVLVVGAWPQEPAYEGTNSCKVCHNKTAEGAQFNQWSETRHAQAYKTLLGDRAKEVAQAKGLTVPPAEAAECLKCHVTSYDAAAKAVAAKIDKAMGVQCETCHGAGSVHVAEAKKFQLARDKSQGLPPLHVQPTKELCVTCHNADNPTWDPKRYTLPDGATSGFDFEQALAKVAHPNPAKKKE